MRGIRRLGGMAAAWLAVGCGSPGDGGGAASTDAGDSTTNGSAGTSESADDDATITGTPPSAVGASSTGDGPEPSTGSTSDTGEPPGLGPLVVDRRHPHVFRREGGDPVFLCGPAETEGFLFRGTLLDDGTRDGDQEELVAKIGPTGANAMTMMVVRSHGGDGDDTENPFVGGDPAAGLDDEVLDQWDWWFGTLGDLGITVVLHVYDDLALVWDTGDVVGSEEQAFLEALVDRFEHHPLLVWVVAENYSEVLSPARASAIAAVIEASDDAGHPIGIGQTEGFQFDFPADPSIDSFLIRAVPQTPAQVHAALVPAFELAQDGYNLTLAQGNDHGTGAGARAYSWGIATAGAYVNVFAQDLETTDPADLEDCGRLVEFFSATPFSEMSPHDELAADDTQWVFARPSEAYILFGLDTPAMLGLADLPAATWRLSWFDPAAGTWIEDELAHPGGPAAMAVPSGFGLHAALYVQLQ